MVDIKLICDLLFKDVRVNVYYDNYCDDSIGYLLWERRNPDIYGTEPFLMDMVTGKCTYTDGSNIPQPKDEDMEVLPKAVIVGTETIDDDMINTIMVKLQQSYLRRNNKK